LIGKDACILDGRDAGFLFGFSLFSKNNSHYSWGVKDLSASHIKRRSTGIFVLFQDHFSLKIIKKASGYSWRFNDIAASH
jgi:hypothetical protein